VPIARHSFIIRTASTLLNVMRIVLLATAPIALPVFDAVAASSHTLVGVITQPDRPSGRNRVLAPSDIRVAARERRIPDAAFERVGCPESLERLRSWQPDILLVFAYGQFIPSSVFNFPPHQAINIYSSLLPRYRGAAPIQWAIADGLAVSGVSIIRVAKEMDSGDILLQQDVPILEDDTSATLSPRMGTIGAHLAVEAINGLEAGTILPRPQHHAEATHARKLTREDAEINAYMPALTVHNRIRAFDPWPGSHLSWPGCTDGPLKIWKTAIAPINKQPPGTLFVQNGFPFLSCSDGALQLLEVQPPGKRRMTGAAFLAGKPLPA